MKNQGDIICPSGNAVGSVTALSVIRDISRAEIGSQLLLGICSTLYVHDINTGKLLASRLALPHGLRIHGISFIEFKSDATWTKFLVAVYGGLCLELFILSIELDEGDENEVRHHVSLEPAGGINGIEKWIMKVCMERLPEELCGSGATAVMCLGTIDNALHRYGVFLHGNGCSPKIKLISSVSGEHKSLLYSMDIFSQLKFCDGKKEFKQSCLVAGGTILLDIVVWRSRKKIVMNFDDDCDDGTQSWDVATETGTIEQLYVLKGHRGSIHCLRWSPNGDILASGSDDRNVKIWDIGSLHRDGKSSIQEIYDHQSLHENVCRIWELHFTTDGSLLFSGSEDGHWICWTLKTYECIANVKAHSFRGVWSIQSYENMLFTGGADGGVKVWNLFDWIPPSTEILRPYPSPWKRQMYVLKQQYCDREELWESILEARYLPELDDYAIGANDEVLWDREKCDTEKSSASSRDIEKDWIRSFNFGNEGRMLLIGTNQGRMYSCQVLSQDLSCLLQGSLKLSLLFQTGQKKPIMILRSQTIGNEIFIVARDIEGTNILVVICLGQMDSSNSWKYEACFWPCQQTVSPGPGLDINVITLHGNNFILSSAGNGSGFIYAISEIRSGCVSPLDSFSCPNGGRIIAVCTLEVQPNMTLIGFGNSSGGVSIWTSYLNGTNLLQLKCIGNFRNAHDKTPVQSVSISVSSSSDKIFHVQSSACNSVVQKYSLRKLLDGSFEFRRLDEQRYDPILVVSGMGPNNCVYGFYKTNFVVWDQVSQAEILKIHCPSWRRQHAMHISRGSILFCYSYSGTEVLLYHRILTKACPPLVLKTPFHGREVNCLASVNPSLCITGGDDATLRFIIWDEDGNFNSGILSSHPGGTAIRVIKKLWTEAGVILIAGGAKRVMTAWFLQHNSEIRDICNISIHADVSIRGKNALSRDGNGHGDIRITNIALLRSHYTAIMAYIVVGMSDGAIELRQLPKNLHSSHRFHKWPLIAHLKTPYDIECPVISLDVVSNASSTMVFAGTTIGDLLGWNIQDAIMYPQNQLDVPLVIVPCLHLEKFHQSGINSLSASLQLSNCFCSIVTGGDDQSIRLAIFDVTTKTLKVASHPNENAHSSAVRSVWSNGSCACSIGLDQKIRVWRLLSGEDNESLGLSEICARYLQVVEPEILQVYETPDALWIHVAGRGAERFRIDKSYIS